MQTKDTFGPWPSSRLAPGLLLLIPIILVAGLIG